MYLQLGVCYLSLAQLWLQIYLEGGRLEEGLAKADWALASFLEIEIPGFYSCAEIYRMKAEFLIAKMERDSNHSDISTLLETDQCFHSAIQIAKQTKLLPMELKALMGRIQFLSDYTVYSEGDSQCEQEGSAYLFVNDQHSLVTSLLLRLSEVYDSIHKPKETTGIFLEAETLLSQHFSGITLDDNNLVL